MYLVGFIIRIYHDARSSECQICENFNIRETGINNGKFVALPRMN